MSPRPKRVIYGTRPLTAKQLAMHLSKRCMRELPNAMSRTKARDESIRLSRDAAARKVKRPAVRHIIDEAHRSDDWGTGEPGAWQFSVQQQTGSTNMYGNFSYSGDWTAVIVVTSRLEVEIYDVQGKSDLRAIERVMLDCALRGR